jgi:Ca-activated chloride channel homolog
MHSQSFLSFFILLGVFSSFAGRVEGQDDSALRVVVNMVQLNVAVTDKNGDYITGLHPEDFVITEDGINEKLATFAEGDAPARSVVASEGDDGEMANAPAGFSSLIAGSNIFILFDTSNYMYRDFVFAQDAISEFVHSLESANKIAFYSYSRDLSRAALPTSDRVQVLRGVRSTVAGDSAALYNALLLTVRDAAEYKGKRIVVVFSNGPDNSSVVAPEDVAELAQSAGVSVYMISTQEAKLEPISTAVFDRMTAATGGKAYFAKSWKDERRAFASIGDDLAHLYSLSYYPKPNPNTGWRAIKVKLVDDKATKYKVRTRDGYRLQRTRFSSGPRTARPDAKPE